VGSTPARCPCGAMLGELPAKLLILIRLHPGLGEVPPWIPVQALGQGPPYL
jgi:hypothetical protein